MKPRNFQCLFSGARIKIGKDIAQKNQSTVIDVRAARARRRARGSFRAEVQIGEDSVSRIFEVAACDATAYCGNECTSNELGIDFKARGNHRVT